MPAGAAAGGGWPSRAELDASPAIIGANSPQGPLQKPRCPAQSEPVPVQDRSAAGLIGGCESHTAVPLVAAGAQMQPSE